MPKVDITDYNYVNVSDLNDKIGLHVGYTRNGKQTEWSAYIVKDLIPDVIYKNINQCTFDAQGKHAHISKYGTTVSFYNIVNSEVFDTLLGYVITRSDMPPNRADPQEPEPCQA